MTTWDDVRRIAPRCQVRRSGYEIGLEDLDEVIVEAWLARAPKALVKTYLESRDED